MTFRFRVIIATTIVGMVAISRVFLGAHYPGDVVGAAIAGVVFLLAMLWLRSWVTVPVTALFSVVGVLASVRLLYGPDLAASVTGAAVIGVFIHRLHIHHGIPAIGPFGPWDRIKILTIAVLGTLLAVQHGIDPLPPIITIATVTSLSLTAYPSGEHVGHLSGD